MAKKFSDDDDALLQALGVQAEVKKIVKLTPREERIIAGFEEIQRFVEKQGHVPTHGDHKDIFERLYAVRLGQMRGLEECRKILEPLDRQNLLDTETVANVPEVADMDDDALLAQLGVDDDKADLTNLRHVRPSAEKLAAEEIANRDRCEDFAKFKPLFDAVEREVKEGIRTTRKFVKDSGFLKADIKKGEFYILGGQTAYVADVGKTIKAPNGQYDARLRVIFSTGTESNLLRRSLQRALYKDEAGRRITEPSAGPLFSDQAVDGDDASGTIYVLRSKSDQPIIAKNRKLIHKIGVTGGKVESRITNAKNDATYLLADVEIVATYELFNINRSKLEGLLHRFFSAARLDIEIPDRFGKKVRPREWFLVPLPVVDEVVKAIQNNTVDQICYSPESASIIPISEKRVG